MSNYYMAWAARCWLNQNLNHPDARYVRESLGDPPKDCDSKPPGPPERCRNCRGELHADQKVNLHINGARHAEIWDCIRSLGERVSK